MNIIYTHNLKGNLAYFPRLYTHIKAISTSLAEKPLLLDLGGACHPSIWHCHITEGRSALLILDAMGYHVAHLDETIPPSSLNKLREQVSMGLVDSAHPHHVHGAYCASTPHLVDTTGVKICLSPADTCGIVAGWVHLPAITGDALGFVQIADGGIIHRIEKIPAQTLPDTTMSGVVDFVMAEARYYQSKRG